MALRILQPPQAPAFGTVTSGKLWLKVRRGHVGLRQHDGRRRTQRLTDRPCQDWSTKRRPFKPWLQPQCLRQTGQHDAANCGTVITVTRSSSAATAMTCSEAGIKRRRRLGMGGSGMI